MGDLLDPGKKARKQAEESRLKQEELIARQRQREGARLAESRSEVVKRTALIGRRRGGRSLLVATSPRGVATLGGGA